ncbi:hypothetical protein AV926_17745 [Myroides marinus]|uniref:Uncharacterized protein n=1 Tax=Myroides marinus TaxID=703342 RepID=A0A163UYY9_9FLAO|nr:hypothetical protein [Myroides marinus]KZE74080.1 hypothetical protein AV926_17745 [Myroides marinus]
MKKRVITIGVLMMSGLAFSQVGIGVKSPHRSALLELKADDKDYRGLLIPRIPLKGLKDKSNINNGDVAVSLLVYNTNNGNDVTPGFYYWNGTEWGRLINTQDIIDNSDQFPRNKVMDVEGEEFILEDTKGHKVRIDRQKLNIETTITVLEGGKYVHKNELGVETVIDVTGSVINNIEEILGDTHVKQEIYNVVASEGKAITPSDKSITLIGGEKAVLNEMQIAVADKGVTTKKIKPGANKQLLVTNAEGKVKWVDATDEVIKEAVKNNETVTLLVDGQDGTFTYYNEKGIDENGKEIKGKGTSFDANTLKIVEKADEKGVYVFYDGKTSLDNPLMTISTRAKSIQIDNSSTIIEGDNVQEVIENIIEKIETAYGSTASLKGDGILINGKEELAESVLKEMLLTIADGAVTPEKIQAGGNKQILITNAKGEVVWVDATDEVIKEAVKNNETVTILQENHNGTFTYYNEKAIDSKTGLPIKNKGVTFDANTLRIEEKKGEKGKGVYVFYDGMTSLVNPLMEISTRANSIHFDNSNNSVIEGDNVQVVIENIIKKIEIAQGKPADIKGEGILINGDPTLAGAVLKEMLLTIENGAITEKKIADQAVTTYKLRDQSVTPVKIEPGANKYILVTKNNVATWVPASDQVIIDVVKQNETVTVLDTTANDGTFIYYNEKGIDKDGNVITGKGVHFDANTLTITDDGKGKYVFRDGKTKTGDALAEIDILGTVIDNITEIIENNKEQIFEVVAAQGKKLKGGDSSIIVEGGDKAVLTKAKISVAPKGITEDKIAPGKDKYILVTKGEEVKWVEANDEVIKEAVKANETVTVLDTSANNGTFIYYNEKAIDKDGNIIPGQGVPFSANTLVITQKDPGKGVYTFYDGVTSIDAPLMTIDVVADVINNIGSIVENENVINIIYDKVAAKGKAATPGDDSIVITGGGKAVLNEMQVAVAPKGITTDKIAPGEKKGQLLVTNGNGDVQWIDATDDIIKEILNSKQAITYIEDSGKGTFTYYNEACFDKDGKRIESVPGVTFDANTLRIEEEEVDKKGTGVFRFYDKSKDTPISTIDVKASVINNIDEILKDTHVQNSIYTTVANKGKEIKSTDASLIIKGEAKDKAVLNEITIDINTDGVKNDHIAALAVTADKIGSGGAVKGSILTSDGLGVTSFKTSTDAVAPAMQGDLKGEAGVIKIVGKDGKEGAGENVLFGDKEVIVTINQGGVTGAHIGFETIKTTNVGNKTITEKKLSAKGADMGAVATVIDNSGTVSYLPITAGSISDKGTISTDGIVSVDNGTGKVLADLKLGINEKSVIATKLSAEGATPGTVATANADGTVTYQNVNTSNIADKAALTTDGIVTVDGGSNLDGVLLKEAKLGIAAGGIGTTQLANLAVTSAKISSEGVGKGRFLLSEDGGTTTWGELDKAVDLLAGDLKSDEIIKITSQDGSGDKALLRDITLSIADNSITKGKLSSENELGNKVLVTDGAGGFEYVGKDDLSYQGQDLTLSNGLEFLGQNDGIASVIKDIHIGVQDRGITTSKISSAVNGTNADANAVLTADGNGNVEYKKINDAVFEGAGVDLKSDKSLKIPANNKAVLNDLTIGIAESGVETNHISNGAVIAAKIGSEASAKGTVLAADGAGNAVFQTLNEIAEAQGSSITSKDKTLRIGGNKAVLEEVNIDVATKGIRNEHIDDQAVTADKIGSKDVGAGLVLTSDANGGAAFKSLGDVLGEGGKTISGAAAISVVGGENAALKDVTIDIEREGVTNEKLGIGAVSTTKIADKAVSTGKIAPGKNNTLLGTDKDGTVKWMNSNDETIKVIFNANEKVTLLKDNEDGTFTYYNEKEVDSKGEPLKDAKGITFDANTVTIKSPTKGVYEFHDKSKASLIGTIDTRATSIVFEGDIKNEYNSVEEAIIDLIAKIEKIENIDIEKAALSGEGILVNGNTSVADGVLKPMTLSIADEAVTPQKIKGGAAKQLLITNEGNKAQWVDGSDDIIKEIVQGNEKITLLEPKDNGTFIYYNESDIDKDGNTVGDGVLFNANTLTIENPVDGKYVFYDKYSTDPLATIDIKETVINNIKELLEEVNVQEQIFNIVANQGKKVSGDSAIEVTGGNKAALEKMTISLKDGGVTSIKVASGAITEDKLFAGTDKADYVPVVQADGTVKYQPMTMVVTGQMLSVDNSLEITGNGDASRALLQELGLQVKADGIGTSHIQNLAVTAEKINSDEANKGAVLMADGSGNAKFTDTSKVISSAMQGDIASDDSLIVVGGENVLFGDKDKKVTLKINEGGVKGTHIATENIVNAHIANNTIEAGKLTAGVGVANRVALADDKGAVTYTPLSTQLLANKGKINVTDGITVSDNGVDKVLADVTLGIQDTSITAVKLHGGNAPEGAVATVGSNGQTVTYQLPTFDHFANKGSIDTDGVVTVVGGDESVLSDITLGIKDNGIDTKQLADNAVKNAQIDQLAVTADKISSKDVGEKRVMISQKDGTVKWGELGDIVTNTAGNLTTDNIIELVKGTGVNTLLADTQIGIKDNSITKDKLSSKDGDVNVLRDYVLVTDGNGGFDYVKKEAVEAGGEDLTLGTALTFAEGDGLNTVLAKAKIDVADGGINTTKLANGAVSKVKISAEGESANAVLTADGKGKVEYKKVNEAVFEGKSSNLVVDSSIKLTGGTAAVLSATSIAIADSGVDNKHIKALAVTNDKISSKVEGKDAVNGTFLTADGKGNTAFKGLSDIAKTQGKEVKSDGSLTMASGNRAALEDLTISVKELGIKNKHIATREVTADKIGANVSGGLVLTANGQGGAEFKSVTDALSGSGKDIAEGAGIAIEGGENAALQDVTISVADKGINNAKIADGAVNTRTIAKNAVGNDQIANNAVDRNKIYIQNIDEKHLNYNSVSTRTVISKAITTDKIDDKAVTRAKIAENAVGYDQIAGSAVHGDVIKDKGVDSSKIDSKDVKEGYVLTADGSGGASFQLAKGGDITKGSFTSEDENLFDIKNGNDAVLKAVSINIKNSGIRTKHIAGKAVGTSELADTAVTTAKVDKGAITTEKIANKAVDTAQLEDKAVTAKKIYSGDAEKGYVLVADGEEGAYWEEAKGGNTSVGDIDPSSTIKANNGNGAVLKDVELEVIEKSIDTGHLADLAVTAAKIDHKAVGTGELADRGVTKEKIADKAVDTAQLENYAVTAKKIYSGDAEEGYVLVADGDEGAYWAEAKGGNTSVGDIDPSSTIKAIDGDGAVLKDVKLEVIEESIDTEHLTDLAVTEEKIYSAKAKEGYVLTADGDGGASFQPAGGGGNVAMPQVFYLPAIYVEIVSGDDTSIELHDFYKEQYGSPMAVNSKATSEGYSLHVYGNTELNYYVTYYDKKVFYDVRVDNDGELHYKVYEGAKPTGRTFFNVVLQVR